MCQRTTARPHHRTCGARDTAPLLTKGGRKRPSDEGWRLRPARPAAESQQDECHMDAQRQCYGTCDVRPSEGDVAARVPGTGRPAHSTNPCAETFSCGCLGRVCPRPCTDERVSRIACEPGVSLLMGRGAPLTDDPNDCSLSVSTQRHPAARTARSSPAINEPARTPPRVTYPGMSRVGQTRGNILSFPISQGQVRRSVRWASIVSEGQAKCHHPLNSGWVPIRKTTEIGGPSQSRNVRVAENRVA